MTMVANDNQEVIVTNIKTLWTIEHEKILVEWADKAMCYRWLHSRSNAMYSTLNAWYTIPVIIISTLTGTANFAQDRVPIDYQKYFVMFIGGFNILAGIITTIQQFLKITQLSESHRVSSIAWDKFYRNIKTEISKHPDERSPVGQMIQLCKDEFDRLMETSPAISDNIIHLFKKEFSKNDKINISVPKIIKPEICDSLISTELSRNPWSSEENTNKRNYQLETKDKENIDMILNFKKQFFDINNREALNNEIIDNLIDKIDMPNLLKTLEYIEKNKNIIEINDKTTNNSLNIV
jgi:hypothetical protein